MLKLTKAGIGLLTRQYRSVLKKCWLINVGAWLFGVIGKTATTLLSQTLRGTLKMSDTEIFKVLDGLSEKRVFKTKLITSTAIGLMVATTILPSDAYAGNTGGTGNIVGWGNSSAFGLYNIASGTQSSAFGYQNTASGNYSSAFGYANHAYGIGSSVFGYYAQAGNSSDDTVTNDATTQSDPRYATAVGAYVQATGLYALALGNQKSGMTQTMASGQSAIAIGTGAQATHDNSVAIGTNSVSAGENTISVGSWSIQRQIKYVAAGTSDTDAVNLKQLNDAIAGAGSGSNYSAGTAALLTAGTDTSNRVWTAKILADYVKGKTDDKISGLSVSGKTITYTKGDGTTGTITTQDTTYDIATTSAAGLMSAADKTRLEKTLTTENYATTLGSVYQAKGNYAALAGNSSQDFAAATLTATNLKLGSNTANSITKADSESTSGLSLVSSGYLDNNYYRKNKKSGILNGFEEGKIGNKNDDNFSKFRADNDNFATVENKVA